MKKAKSHFAILLLMIGSFLIVAFFIGVIRGDSIEHVRQYLFPSEGRIVFHEGSPMYLQFDLLDEKEVSELSQKENIKSMTVLDEEGKSYSAEEWEITSRNHIDGSGIVTKSLRIKLNLTKEATVNELIIDYPDKQEIFDIGEIICTPFKNSRHSAALSMYMDIGKKYMEETSSFQSKQLPPSVPAYAFLTAGAFEGDTLIKNIDFGVSGLAFDASTIRMFTGSIDVGPAFQNNPGNRGFFQVQPVERLPESDLNIELKQSDAQESAEETLMIGIRNDASYKANYVVKIISPVYNCVDIKSGENFTYADYNQYIRISPFINNKDFAEGLLEEHGQ